MPRTEPVNAEAAEFLRHLEQQRVQELPTLSADELLALGDSPALRDAGEDRAWQALGERERNLVLATARHGLTARGLLTEGPGGHLARDPLPLVLAARAEPSCVLVGTQLIGTRPQPVRAHGFSVSGTLSIDAFLLEAVLDETHGFLLTSKQEALTRLGDWLCTPYDGPQLAAEHPTPGRMLEILQPPPGPDGAPSRHRMIVAVPRDGGPGGYGAVVDADGTAGETWPADAATTAERLAEILGLKES